MATKNTKEPVVETTTEDKILLTVEEFERKQRKETREKINKVTRVFGVGAILLIIIAAILEPLFELTYFGALWDKIVGTSEFNDGWAMLSGTTNTGTKIFDNILMLKTPWMAELGITILYILVLLGTIYFLTYCIVDVIDLFKIMYKTGHSITHDLGENVKDVIPEEKPKKNNGLKKITNLFTKKEEKELTGTTEIKRRKEKKVPERDELSGLSSDDLDRLLRGETIEQPTEKSLF